jgi:archaellum component FlaC
MAQTKVLQQKYKDLLGQTQDQKDQQELQFRVEEGEHQLSADLLATRRSLAAAKADLLKTKGSYPLNTKNIVDSQLKVEGLEDGIKRLEALKAELF